MAISAGTAAEPANAVACWPMTNAKCSGWTILNSDYSNQNLSGSDYSSAKLIDVVLSGANIANVKFAGATFTRVTTGSLVGTPASLPSGWKLMKGYFVGPGALLNGANLTSADLAGIDLSGTNLASATLTGVASGGITGLPTALPSGWALVNGYLVGPGAVLTNANLAGADLSGVDLSGATLTGVSSGAVTGSPIALPSGWALVNGYLVGPGAVLRGANLSGADLSNVDLTGAELGGVSSGGVIGTPLALPFGWAFVNGYLVGAGAVLTNADLKSADLTGLDLSAAILRGIDLRGANLTRVILSRADVSGALLDGATLKGVTSDVSGSPASLPTDWLQLGRYLLGPGANLAGVDLSYCFSVNTRANVNLSEANLRNVNLSHCEFYGAQLQGADLTGANLDFSTLYSSNVDGTNFTGTSFTCAFLSKLDMTAAVLGGNDFRTATFYKVNFSHADLSSANLQSAMSTGADFSFANLSNPTVSRSLLTDANLVGASLAGAQVGGSYFVGKDLTGVSFVGANLDNADFTGAIVDDVDLTAASIKGVRSNFLSNKGLKVPTGFLLFHNWLVGPSAKLSGADLSGINLDGIDLTGADLVSANFGSQTGRPLGLPKGYKLIGGFLVGPGAWLFQRDMTNFDFSGMDLTGTNFDMTNLAGANFTNAVLDSTHFAGSNLSGANLSGARLLWLDLSTANLTGVRTAGTFVSDGTQLPNSVAVMNGYLVGPNLDLRNADLSYLHFYIPLTSANLSGANLHNSNLSGVSLVGADLSGADLSNCDLSFAKLSTANLDGADLSSANLSNASMNDIVGVPKSLPDGWVLRGSSILSKFNDAPVPSIQGVFGVGQTLTAFEGAWGQSTLFSYRWLRSGTLVGTSSTYEVSPLDLGQAISLEVTAKSPNFLDTSMASASVVISPGTIQVAPVPSVQGTAAFGSTLTASTGVWSSGVSLQYRWLRGSTPVGQGPSYKIQLADVGSTLRLEVTGSRDGYATETRSTTYSQIVAKGTFPTTFAPSISGTAKAGKLLKVTVQAGVKGAKISIQWLLDGKKISKATTQNLKILPAYRGHKVSVSVNETLSGYVSKTVTSKALKVA